MDPNYREDCVKLLVYWEWEKNLVVELIVDNGQMFRSSEKLHVYDGNFKQIHKDTEGEILKIIKDKLIPDILEGMKHPIKKAVRFGPYDCLYPPNKKFIPYKCRTYKEVK